MHKYCLSLFLGCNGLLQAAAYQHVYSLGDSLSDAGTFQLVADIFVPESKGRFTTNPKQVWVQHLAHYFGQPSTPYAEVHFIVGGFNHAEGGAQISGPGFRFPGIPITQQTQELLESTGGKLPQGTLVTFMGGANDVFTQYQNNPDNLPLAIQNMKVAATEAAALVRELNEHGAKTVFLNTLPDISLTPFGQSQDQAGREFLSTLCKVFNDTLVQEINRQGGKAITTITERILAGVVAEPARFGFANVDQLTTNAVAHATERIPGDSSLFAVEGVNIPVESGKTWVFADSVHPGGEMHRIVSDSALSLLQAPGHMANLVLAPYLLMQQNQDEIDRRLLTPERRCASRFALYAGYTHAGVTLRQRDLWASSNTQANGVTIGGDMRLSPNWLLGVAFQYTDSICHEKDPGGRFDLNQYNGFAYTRVALSKEAALFGVIGGGSLNFDNVSRFANVGIASLTAHGKTSGSYFLAKVGAEYRFTWRCLRTGPILFLAEESVRVKGFQESGDFIAIGYHTTDLSRLRLSAGWELIYNGPCFQPFLRASYENIFGSDLLPITFGMDSALLATSQVSMPGLHYTHFNGGFNYALNPNLTLYLQAGGNVGQWAATAWDANAGLQYQF